MLSDKASEFIEIFKGLKPYKVKHFQANIDNYFSIFPVKFSNEAIDFAMLQPQGKMTP